MRNQANVQIGADFKERGGCACARPRAGGLAPRPRTTAECTARCQHIAPRPVALIKLLTVSPAICHMSLQLNQRQIEWHVACTSIKCSFPYWLFHSGRHLEPGRILHNGKQKNVKNFITLFKFNKRAVNSMRNPGTKQCCTKFVNGKRILLASFVYQIESNAIVQHWARSKGA